MRGSVVMGVTHREACASHMFYMVIWREAQLRSAGVGVCTTGHVGCASIPGYPRSHGFAVPELRKLF